MGRKRRSNRSSSSSSEEEYLRRKIKRLQRKLDGRNEKRGQEQLHRSRSPSWGRRDHRRFSSYSRSRSGSPDERPLFFDEDVPLDGRYSVDSEGVIDPLQTQLDQRVLNAMGTIITKHTPIGEPLNEVLASQCNMIVKSGLPEDRLNEILAKYRVPENCPLFQPPKLNPEIRAAINESAKKRDEKLIVQQKEVGVALIALGKAESILLDSPDKDDTALVLIENLSDAACILSKMHHNLSEYRSLILSMSLNQHKLQPHFKEALTDAPLDSFLFGENLTDRLKAAKALGQSVADLKAGPSRSRTGQTKDLNLSVPSRRRFVNQRRGGQTRYQTQKEEKRGREGERYQKK